MVWVLIALAAAMILAGVLWVRPWYDDHNCPYD
jgi:hypothetical protein